MMYCFYSKATSININNWCRKHNNYFYIYFIHFFYKGLNCFMLPLLLIWYMFAFCSSSFKIYLLFTPHFTVHKRLPLIWICLSRQAGFVICCPIFGILTRVLQRLYSPKGFIKPVYSIYFLLCFLFPCRLILLGCFHVPSKHSAKILKSTKQ